MLLRQRTITSKFRMYESMDSSFNSKRFYSHRLINYFDPQCIVSTNIFNSNNIELLICIIITDVTKQDRDHLNKWVRFFS